MSFSLTVKEDLLKINNDDSLSNRLELEAMLRFAGEISLRPMKISFSCNNMGIIRRLIKLCKKYYEIEYEIFSRIIDRFDNHTIFTCEIQNGAEKIVNDLNLLMDFSSYASGQLSEEGIISYLRGAFLVKGSVNDPNSKSSHLEISTTVETQIIFVQKLMNYFDLNARISKRKNYLIVYLKAKQAIGDFLYRIGAMASMEYYEDIVITKEIKATAKRTVNLDVANQDKTNRASKDYIKYINYLTYNYPLEELDSKLLMVMKVRKDYPEYSLSQLLEVIHDDYDPNLTKSGLNHRLRRIKELAIELQEKKKKENDDA